MSIIRVNKTKDYTVMSNHHLRNKNLTLKAKGLLSLMFSLPDDWNYSIAGLCSICKENKTAIKSAIKELQECGYIFVDKLLPDETNSKKLEYVYNIYENPEDCKKYKSKRQKEIEMRKEKKQQGTDFLTLDSLPVENRIQLNTNILNTNKYIDASNSNELKDRGVDASFSKKKKAGSPDKEIFKSDYSQEELECYLPNKLRSLYAHESTDNDERVEEFVQIIMYFYKRYKFYRKENHPILTDISYRKIIMEYLCPPETMMKYGEFSFDTYREMIELHFKTEYGKYKKAPEGFNYRISLFMSDNIREHLYRRVEEAKN